MLYPSFREQKPKNLRSHVILPIVFMFLLCNFSGYETGEDNKEDLGLTPLFSRKKATELVLDDFNKGLSEGVFHQRKNSLGFYHGTWAQRPSYAYTSKSAKYRRGDSGLSLELRYRKEKGWCGWYTRLEGLDISKYNILSFWVKGGIGTERFDIGFIDKARDNARMDAVYAGPVDHFLKGQVQSGWKEVKVPLSRVAADVDLTQLSAIVFWFKYRGDGSVFIDDLVVKKDPQIASFEQANLPKADADSEFSRSLWIWKVDPVSNIDQRKGLFEFCARTNISQIQFFIGTGDLNENPKYYRMLREFNAECHKNHLRVEALNGHPIWALKDHHREAISWVNWIRDYNGMVAPNERFDGLTLDIEPYLTKDWILNKEGVKFEFIELLQQVQKLLESQQGGETTLGCAIPYFFKDEGSFLADIARCLDSLYLMSYFDSSAKIVSSSAPCFDSVEESGKKVWITVETQDVVNMHQGANRNTFFEEGWKYMEDELQMVNTALGNLPAYTGISIHYYSSYRQLRKEKIRPQNFLRLEKPDQEVTKIYSYQKTKPIIIDGSLDDWQLETTQSFTGKERVVYGAPAWKGTEDLSFDIRSMWDEETLYFACQVTDDVLLANHQNQEIWQDDHLELWLDIDLAGDFTEAVNSTDDIQFGFSPGNFESLGPQGTIWTPESMLLSSQDITLASSRKDSGYIMEIAIPRTLLYNDNTVPISSSKLMYSPALHTGRQVWYITTEEFPPPEKFFTGYRMGISLEASDTDDSESPQKCLLSSSIDRSWGNPTTFGFLEFRGPKEDFSQEQFHHGEKQPQGVKQKSKEVAKGSILVQVQKGQDENIRRQEKLANPKSVERQKAKLVGLELVPDPIPSIHLQHKAFVFGLRGKIGKYHVGLTDVKPSIDEKIYYDSEVDLLANDPDFPILGKKTGSYQFSYRKKNESDFCGGYIVISGDLSQYKTLVFLVKGAKGKESFLVGMHDIISNRREEAIFCGSIYRYLPEGLTTDWQVVTIPLKDFYGLDLGQTQGLVFQFNEIGEGEVWIDALHFSEQSLVDRKKIVEEKGYFLVDDFNHSDLNLLGCKALPYQSLPSTCEILRVPVNGEEGENKCLRLEYKRMFTGWCGYYSLLHQIDGVFYDLTDYESVSFKAKGEQGKEKFEIGMADRNWTIIGDSLKAGGINKYLPNGLTRDWQEVTIPLPDFGALDFREMGSLVFNFKDTGEGILYIDDIKLNLKSR